MVSVWSFCLFAHSVSVRVEVDRNILVQNENTTLQIIIENGEGGETVSLPKVDFCQIRSMGQSSQTSIINGNMSQAVIYNYLLIPLKVGKFNFPEVVVKGGSWEKKTEPI